MFFWGGSRVSSSLVTSGTCASGELLLPPLEPWVLIRGEEYRAVVSCQSFVGWHLRKNYKHNEDLLKNSRTKKTHSPKGTLERLKKKKKNALSKTTTRTLLLPSSIV